MARYEDQPRWPKGTPTGPGGRGPGGGRWRDGDGVPGPGMPGGGGPTSRLGRWAQRISDLIGRRRGRSDPDAQAREERYRGIARRYGLPEDADSETVGTRIRQASTTSTHMRPGETPEQYDERLRAAVAASPYWTPKLPGDGPDPLAGLPERQTQPGARVIDSGALAGRPDDDPLFSGDYEVLNPETGEWETLESAGFDGRAGVDFVGITTRDRDGNYSGFTTSAEPDPEDYEGGEDDEDYDQALLSWEEDETVSVLIRRKGSSGGDGGGGGGGGDDIPGLQGEGAADYDDWADQVSRAIGGGGAPGQGTSPSSIRQALDGLVTAQDLNDLTDEMIEEAVEQARIDQHSVEGGGLQGMTFREFVIDQLVQMLRNQHPSEIWPHLWDEGRRRLPPIDPGPGGTLGTGVSPRLLGRTPRHHPRGRG